MGYQKVTKGKFGQIAGIGFYIMVVMGLLLHFWSIPIQASSSNNLLSDVKFDIGSLNYEFSPTRIYYKLTLPKDTSKVDVIVTPQDSSANYSIAGHTNINQSSSTGKIVVTVTAANGNRKWYTFEIQFGEGATTTRATSTSTTLNQQLANLAFDIGTLNIPFDTNVKNYTLTLPTGTMRVDLVPTPISALNIEVTGNNPIDLNAPKIVVTAPSGTYQFDVVFSDFAVSTPTDTTNSKDFGLEYLEVKDHTLSKAFRGDLYEYQVIVTDATEKFEVQAIATEPEAMIEIDQERNRIKIVVSTDQKRATYVIRLVEKNQVGVSGTLAEVFQDLLISLVLLTLAVMLFILSRKVKNDRARHLEDSFDEE